MNKKPFLQFILGVTILVLAFAQLSTGKALAYNASGAVNYAEQYALGNNWNYPVFIEDCTNFGSQVLHQGGGYPELNSNNNVNDDNQWFVYGSWLGGWHYSNSWVNATSQYNFQMLHYPGGWLWAGPIKSSDNAYWQHYDAINPGDELFYNFEGNTNTIDHMGVQVNSGGSNYLTGMWGSLQDQHSNARKHAMWSLLDVNANWSTTVIWEVHIDQSN